MQIAPSLTMLFNKSLQLGIFPGDWKLVNIVLIFKKGKRDFVENCHPTSLLPVISKVLKHCLLVSLRDNISHLIKQQVTVLWATSWELPVTSRVPQGSLLGPTLFLFFVDDPPNTVKTLWVACYADDTKIFKSIDSITGCNALQSDLNDLVSWCESSGLIFDQSKCKYQCITRKKITCITHLYYQRNACGILRYRERPWCVGVKQCYLGQTSDWTVCESQ